MREKEILLHNIDKIHTTLLGINRIKKNLKLLCTDNKVVPYCKDMIKNEKSVVYKQGKNYYCEIDYIKIVINSSSYTIITAHIIK